MNLNTFTQAFTVLIDFYKNKDLFLDINDFVALSKTCKDMRTFIKYQRVPVYDYLKINKFQSANINYVSKNLLLSCDLKETYIAHLIFNHMGAIYHNYKQENIMNQINYDENDTELELYEPPSKKFKLFAPVQRPRITWPNNVDKLIILNVCYPIQWLPHGLQVLHIVVTVDLTINFLPQSLKKLTIKSNSNVVSLKTLPSSLFLEVLVLDSFVYNDTLNFPALKSLTIFGKYDKSINHLQNLEYVNILDYDYNLIENLPKLIKLRINGSRKMDLKSLNILQDLILNSHAEVMKIDSNEMPNLEKLEVIRAEPIGIFTNVKKCISGQLIDQHQFPNLEKVKCRGLQNCNVKTSKIREFSWVSPLKMHPSLDAIQILSHSLQTLKLHTNINIDCQILPSGLLFLEFNGKCFNLECLPGKLEVLIICHYTDIYDDLYFENGHYHLKEFFYNHDMRFWKTGKGFQREYTFIDHSYYCSQFEDKIENLPKSLTYINMNCNFNHNLNAFKDLTKLRFLKLTDLFNKQLTGMLPDNLEYLFLGTYFNGDLNHLPRNLTYLDIIGNYSRPIRTLPPNLRFLKISGKFSNEINLPKNIQKLIIFGKSGLITSEFSLDRLETLILSGSFIFVNHLPALKNLALFCESEDILMINYNFTRNLDRIVLKEIFRHNFLLMQELKLHRSIVRWV